MCSWGGLLDLRSHRCGHLIFLFQQSSTPAIEFILEVSRENKAPIYPTWQTPAVQPRSHLSFLMASIQTKPGEREKGWDILRYLERNFPGPLYFELTELFSFFFFNFYFWPCSMAYEILVPQPGMELAAPAVEAQSLNHWTIRKALNWLDS